MGARQRVAGVQGVARQRGQAVLLTILVALVLGFGALSYTFIGSARHSISTDKVTQNVLAQAREALIGYAAADSNRPGALPCPDTDNDGSADLFVGSECPSYVGRLPWRTLGLIDLRDGSGERLWYAVTREFARNPTCGAACPLNTDTKGTLTITGTNPKTDVVAVIFAPGGSVGTQLRSPANQNNAAHYLEGGNETGAFVTAAATPTFNDRLLPLSGADVMTPVERRAAREMLTLLWAYRSNSDCACYPWADRTDDGSSDGRSNSSYLAGRVPLESASPDDWNEPGININTTTYPALAWLKTNKWWWVFFYTIAASESASHGSGDLTVNSVPGTKVVLITTGPAAGVNRPVTSWDSWSDWQWYVDDPDNRDGGTNFYTPWSTAYARDRLYTLF